MYKLSLFNFVHVYLSPVITSDWTTYMGTPERRLILPLLASICHQWLFI